MPSVLPRRIAANGSPVTTEKFQHWLLNDEGARIATSRISAISARGTGLSRKPRIERRPTTTSSKPAACFTRPAEAAARAGPRTARKSDVEGTGVSVCVITGGRRIRKKKKKTARKKH